MKKTEFNIVQRHFDASANYPSKGVGGMSEWSSQDVRKETQPIKISQMKRNHLINYNPNLKQNARRLRKKCTPSEALLWLKIRRKSLGYEFHRQVPINEFIVDFYCHELHLAIEVDGNSHDNKVEYDKLRQDSLEKLGVKFIRFNNDDINKDITNVLRIIISVIDEIEDIDFKTSP